MKHIHRVTTFVCLLCLASGASAQVDKSNAASKSKNETNRLLSVDRIYAGSEFVAKSVAARWMKGHSGYLSTESAKSGTSIISTDPATGTKTILVAPEDLVPEPGKSPLKIEGYSFSKKLDRVLIYTNSKRVWRRNTRGDYWVLDRSSHDLKKLGGDADPATLMFAKFSPDGSRVAYVRERNIYVEHLDNNTIQQITETRTPDIINGTFDWVYEEELGLRDGYRWSPDGTAIAYWRIDTTGVHKFPLVNNTAGLYPDVQWFAYPKTGQQNPVCQVRIFEFQSNASSTIELTEIDIRTKRPRVVNSTEQSQRDNYIARMDWVERPKGEQQFLMIQQLNRLQNTNRVFLGQYYHSSTRPPGTPPTVLTSVALEDTDEAWINVHDETHWLNDGRFTWVSERDGWRHVYLASHQKDAEWKLLTPGHFDVIQLIRADPKSGRLYFLASPNNATQKYLYQTDMTGNMQRLTPADQSGTHSYNISPDGRWAIHNWSSGNKIPFTEVISLPTHKTVRVLQDNKALKEKLETIDLATVEMLSVDIGDGIELDGWCIKPPKMDPKKKYPVLVYVYGEPAGQSVLDRWGGSSYLWHAMLAQKGYVVMSFDNRGTPAPKGRVWRKSVYRKVGIISPKEQAAALKKMLKDRAYLDETRIGIWGWSGGGSSTLQALFKYPDLYHTGISIAPVPNQRYYDTIYQERYMGLPRDNFEGYRNGSPMNFAKNLKGNLLLIHGTGDDNCHYQTTEMLINELIKHNKQFSMMAYPNRTHSIKEGRNTTRHLRSLMTNYLLKNLPVERH
jgi:dipeptidyl-peptidase 4